MHLEIVQIVVDITTIIKMANARHKIIISNPVEWETLRWSGD
jgi:hypothetical protein